MFTEQRGIPFHGEVHSTDASAGVAITLYENGSTTARTLDADEYIVIDYAHLVTAAGGDSYILVGDDATLTAGETVIRGTFATNGGTSGQLARPFYGALAATPFVVSPAGAVDAIVRGSIRREQMNPGGRPDWRESQVPGV